MRNDEWISKFHHEFENSFAEDNRLRPIKFTSGYGYSIVGFYDKRHKRHMGMDKTIHYAPMYKFYVDEKKSSDNEHIPLFISVATTVEEQEDGEKRYMLTYKKIKRFRPVELNSSDEFFVEKKTGKVYEKVREEYIETTYRKIFERIKRVHISDVFDLKAIVLRFRILVFRVMPTAVFSTLSWACGWVVWLMKGKRYTYDVIMEGLLESRDNKRDEEASSDPKESIDFFGYRVSIWTLCSYSALILILTPLVNLRSKLSNLGGIETIAIAIVSIVIYDKIAPTLLRKIIKSLSTKAYNINFKSLKIDI